MTTVANASVVFKDKNGNVGTVKGASANDITKISNAISDVAQVVNPTTHLPINATTSSVGVVQLADSAAIAAGTTGRIVDAAQLKDAIEHVTPAGNLMTTDTAQTVTAVKTFSSLPESSVVPTTNNQLVNKKYVDDHTPTGVVDLTSAQTISGLKTFSTLPQSSVVPTSGNELVNKTYVDGKADIEVAATYAEPSVNCGVLSPATNIITPPGSAQTFEARGVKTGTVQLYAGASIPTGYLLCNGAAVSRNTYADLFAAIGTIYGAGDGSTTFNLPDFRDRYAIGANTNALGTKVAEQLPNITGLFDIYDANGYAMRGYGTGAVYCTEGSYRQPAITSGSGSGMNAFNINSAYSNSIYTDSGHVYPLSLALNFIIKA